MAEWKPIDELFDYEKGTLQSSKCTPGKYTFITAAEEWKTHETFTHDCEALIFAMAASGSLGRTHYVNGKFVSSDLCFILTPKKGLRLDLTFYYRLFNFLRADIVKKTATGTSKLAINQTNFGAYKLPYFDYEHQLSFRGKIETIAGINEEFFEGMDYQLSLLAKMRQAVLQEAIEGNLTAEWRKHNPHLISGRNHASKLLDIILAEKERLIKKDKIREEKPLPPITDDEEPFVLPDGWVWCRLNDVSQIFAGFSFNSYDFKIGNGAKCIKITNAGVKEIVETNHCLPESFIKKYPEFLVKEGDLIIALTRPYIASGLKVSKCPKSYNDALLNQRVAAIRKLPSVHFEFIYLFMISDFVLNRYKEKFEKANLQPNLRIGDLTGLEIPLPPLAEQQVIAERVDTLFVVIYELKKQVAERKKQSELLMQSVLREAFEHGHA